MTRLRFAPAFAVVFLAGCPGSPPATPAPTVSTATTASVASGEATVAPPTPSSDADGAFVPLDEVDHMELPPELVGKLTSARAKIPAKLTPEQKGALEDLESRYQRIEAATLDEGASDDKGDDDKPASAMRQADAIAHALAGFYWDRLRLFDPSLDVEVPDDLVHGFATSGRGSR